MSIRIGASPNRRMPRRCNEVGVIVVAIGKVNALLQEEIPTILRFELRTISIQVVPPKLIKYQDHNQLRLRIVRIRSQLRRRQPNHSEQDQPKKTFSHIQV